MGIAQRHNAAVLPLRQPVQGTGQQRRQGLGHGLDGAAQALAWRRAQSVRVGFKNRLRQAISRQPLPRGFVAHAVCQGQPQPGA